MAHGTAFNPTDTAFARGDGASPEVFTKIAEVLSINHSGKTVGTRDTTSLDTAGAFNTARGTRATPGSYAITMKLNLAEIEKLEDDMEDHADGGDPTNYKITYKTGVIEIIPGIVTDVSREGSLDSGEWTATATITAAGAAAYTPPA